MLEDAILNQELNEALERRVALRTRELEAERTQLAQRVAELSAELGVANRELLRGARLRDEFLSTVSHELRTPLAAILNLTEALQLEIYGPLTARQVKTLQNVMKSAHHLLALINDVLDLARLEAGGLEFHIMPAGVKSVCQAALAMVQEQARHKQIEITFNYDDAIGTMRTDERLLQQVLVKLLENAIKFTPEAGKIGLQVWRQLEQDLICFAVWDTGIGIAVAEQPLLFEPLMQLDASLTRKFGGTGLGLAIVKRIVEIQGGQITVESTPGQGSRFTICLPWQPVKAAQP